MKHFLITTVVLFIMAGNADAQAPTPAEQSSQIAKRMKDSLSLTEQQRGQIEAATLDIQHSKTTMRQFYKSRALDYYLQMAEDNRDSVYKNILSADKYLLFRQKKTQVLGSN